MEKKLIEHRPVVGYEGLYEVSIEGDVWSIRSKKYLSPYSKSSRKDDYQKVHLSCNGFDKNAKIHIVVLEAFVPRPSDKHEVNHKDGDRTNNRLDNLEWMTRSENMKDMWNRKNAAKLSLAEI